MKSLLSVFSFFTILSLPAVCQSKYPKGYFRWPLNITPSLAANFGELRPNHFHMGLDCRTDKKVNQPVYAAADGYVAKVKIEPGGFGRAIYINHPNGLTTLYAHLNAFFPALEDYVKEQQYKQEKWNVYIDIPENLFSVNKGDFIAFSGNTGGSQGPHLHFEIRDTKTDKVLNPLLFGFSLKDNIPPDIRRLAIYNRNKSTYEQTPVFIFLRRKDGIYQAPNVISVNSDKISFGITAFDRYTGSTSQNGIYKASISDNGRLLNSFILDSISYDETRYLNAHIDYRMKATSGSYIQHISRLPGYQDGVYKGPEDGVIWLGDNVHQIQITIADAAGNQSVIKLSVKRNPNSANETSVLPNQFVPGYVNIFDNDTLRLQLSENQVYDSFYFRYNEIHGANGTVYQVNNPSIPVHDSFMVNIKPRVSYIPGKVVMRRFGGSKDDYSATTFNNGWFSGRFREFGNYELLEDNQPPIISPVSISRYGIVFNIKDNTKNIINFTASINGKWTCFSNDKKLSYVYTFDEHCPPGQNTLTISCEDLAGNRTERTINFYRP